jgi:hypothetical protein
MIQERSVEYRTQDSSYKINRHALAGLPAGLYAGFDPTLGATMDLVLHHNDTGFVETDLTNTLLPTKGVVVSRQGVRVYEPDTITLPITPTTVTGRRDAIVMEHTYIEVAGGQSATFTVIEGVPESPTLAPNQVLLGLLLLPANCTALNQSGVDYTPYRILDLKEVGNTLNTKYDKIQSDIYTVPDGDYSAQWEADSLASKFRVLQTQSGEIRFAGRIKALASPTTFFLSVENQAYLPTIRSKFVAHVVRGTSIFPILVEFIGTDFMTLSIASDYAPQQDDVVHFDNISFPNF